MCHFNKSSVDFEYPVAHTACSLCLAVLGTVGNASSIYLIWRGRLYNSRIMALLTNLCLANLILTALVMPLLCVNSFHQGWRYGDTFCQVFGYVLYVTLSSEFLILNLITITQYLIVVQNATPSSTAAAAARASHRAKTALVLVTPWLFSMAIYVLPLARVWDRFDFDPRVHMCTLVNLTGILGMKSTISLGLLLGSTAVIVYCYLAIYCVHHRSRNKTAPSLQRAPSVAAARNRRGGQLIRMITVILINFAITYIPFLLLYAIDPCLRETPPSVLIIILYVSFSHSATNPIIYALMNKQICAQWKRVLSQCLHPRHVSAACTEGQGGSRDNPAGRQEMRQGQQRDQVEELKEEPLVDSKH